MTRLLLDEHLSGRIIGKTLEGLGHDVKSISGDKNLEGLEDDAVLGLAISEERILVTANVSDFMPLLVGLSEVGMPHYGCLLIPNSFRNEHFGAIVSAIEDQLEEAPPDAWEDRVAWLRKRQPHLSPKRITLVHGSKRRISGLAFRPSPNHKIHTLLRRADEAVPFISETGGRSGRDARPGRRARYTYLPPNSSPPRP